MIPSWIERRASNPEFIAHIVSHMRLMHTGQAQAAKADSLLSEMLPEACGVMDAGLRHKRENLNRVMRRCFEVANQEHGALILSDTENGYWWSDGSAADIEAVEKMANRGRTILANASALMDNIRNAAGGQQKLL